MPPAHAGAYIAAVGAWTIPNLITLARLLGVPVFVWLHVSGRGGAALAVFVACGVSDGLDGLLARALDQRSRLGGILDPVADKALLLSALVCLAITGQVPWWFLSLVLFREGLMGAAALAIRRRGWRVPAAPTRLGKFGLLLQLAVVALGLVSRALPEAVWLEPWRAVTLLLAAEAVTVGGVHYAFRHSELMAVSAGPGVEVPYGVPREPR